MSGPVSSCCRRQPRIHPSFWVGVLARMTDWNSISIHITLDPHPLSKEWINHSVWGRPSAGPRKPLITGSSCLQCRPLIVLSESRCGSPASRCSLFHGGSAQSCVAGPSLPSCLTNTSGTDRRPPESPPPARPPAASVIPAPPLLPGPIARRKSFKQGGNSPPPPLLPHKAYLRVWLNTFMPGGPDEIKHRHRALYVSQKTLAMFITSDHLGFTHVHVCRTRIYTALTHGSGVLQAADSLLAAFNLSAGDMCLL